MLFHYTPPGQPCVVVPVFERFNSPRGFFGRPKIDEFQLRMSKDTLNSFILQWFSLSPQRTILDWMTATDRFYDASDPPYTGDIMFDAAVAQYTVSHRFLLVKSFLPIYVSTYPWHKGKLTKSTICKYRANRPDLWSILKPAVDFEVKLYSHYFHTQTVPHSEIENEKEARRRTFSKRKAGKEKEKGKVKTIPLRNYMTHPNWKPMLEVVDEKFKNHPHADGLIESCSADVQDLLETIVLGAAGIINAKSNASRLIDAALVYKALTKKCITKEILEFFGNMFDKNFPHGADGDDSEKGKDSLIDSTFLRSNWRILKNHRMFDRFSTLLSSLVSMGFCEAAGLTWTVNGLTIFDPLAKAKNMNAADVVDAFVDTSIFFFEAGHACFTKGSFKPLMFGDMLASEFDELHAKIELFMMHYKSGNTELLDMSESDISQCFDRAVNIAKQLKESSESPYEKSFYRERHLRMCKARSEFIVNILGSDLRVAPYTLLVYGTSGVGKSTVSRMFAHAVLRRNGFDDSPERIAYLNEADQFYSNYKTSINLVILDDMCNTKPQFLSEAPTNKVLRINNNAPEYANMADVESKGQVMIRPKLFIVTTNVKHVNAAIFSMEPISILRRFQHIITVEVKENFAKDGRLDTDKVNKASVNNPFVDAWYLTVEEVYGTKEKNYSDVNFRTIDSQVGLLGRTDLDTVVTYLCDESVKHYETQKSVVQLSSKIAKSATPCTNCKRYTCVERDELCKVGKAFIEDECEEVVEDETTDKNPVDEPCLIEPHGLVSNVFSFTNWLFPKMCSYARKEANAIYTWWLKPFSKWSDSELVLCAQLLGDYVNDNYYMALPTWFVTSDTGKRFLEWSEKKRCEDRHPFFSFYETIHNNNEISSPIIAGFIFLAYKWPLYFAPPLIPFFYFGYRYLRINKSCRSYEELLTRNQQISSFTKHIRDHTVTAFVAGSVALASCYAFFQLYKRTSAILTIPHTISPTCLADIEERDGEVNPWLEVVTDKAPLTDDERAQRTITDDQFVKKIANNVFHLTYTFSGGKTGSCNVVFLSSCIGLMPKHIWHESYCNNRMVGTRQTMVFECRKTMAIGGLRSFVLNYEDMVEVAPDLLLFYTASIGEHADISKYLQVADYKSVPANLVFRNKDCNLQEFGAHMVSKKVSHVGASFEGAEVVATTALLQGMCMSPYLSKGKSKFIAGFHIGGTEDTHGIAIRLTKDTYDKGVVKLKKMLPHALTMPEKTDVPDTRYGKEIFVEGPIPPKSPVNFLPSETPVRLLGPCNGAVTPKSNVVETLLANHFEKHMGFKPCWGPPKLKPKGQPWKPWRDTLVHLTNPAVNMPHRDMRWAMTDYLKPLKEKIKDKMFHEHLKPLSRLHIVSGIDGVRFIDRMAPKTSTGMYLGGPKSKFLLPVISDDETVQVKFTFPDYIWEEFEKAEELLRNGKRPGTVFKACLKDEPTRLDKDKVRVFEAAELLLQLLLRKYFLPVARFLSLIPLVSECAVGINATGPEWEELHNYMTKFGKDRILAGDYSKYDLRMPADAVMAAFAVLIDLARTSGNYTEDDLKIMETLSSEVIYPFVAYNGVLVQLLGSNPSGQNLTVYINSIVNSLQMRCAWHSIYGNRYEFQSYVTIATYGDDVKGSVHRSKNDFNCISVANYFEKYDQKFTPPDKKSDPVPYMTDANADFLKRKSVYVPELGQHVGALDRESIFKALCCAMEDSDLTPAEQAVENARTAAEEFFYHGKDVYDEQRKKLKKLLASVNLANSELEIPFEQRVERWKNKYKAKNTDKSQSGMLITLSKFLGNFWDEVS